MNTYQKLRWIYLAAHIGTFIALYIGTGTDWLIALFAYLAFQVFGVGIAIHRYSAHRSFETYAPVKFFLLIMGTLCTVGSSVAWSGLHRLHHSTSDTDKDPHSPHFLPIRSILSGRYMQNSMIPPRLIRDLVKDSAQIFFHRNYFRIIFIYNIALLLIGPKWLLFGYLVPVTAVYWVTAAGIVLNHTWGYRNFLIPDLSVNSWPLSLITFGDGWHNNHHFDPSRPSHAVRWWEFDLCFMIIRCLRLPER